MDSFGVRGKLAFEAGVDVLQHGSVDCKGGSPYVPPLQGLGIVAVAATIAFGAMALPARSLMRRPPKAGGD